MHRLAHLNVVKPLTVLSPDDENTRYFFARLPEVFANAAACPGMHMHTHAFRTVDGEFLHFEDFEKQVGRLGQPHVMTIAVWESLQALMDFTYRGSVHGKAMKPLRDWVSRDEGPTLVLWWLGPGERVTPESAWDRLMLLRENGPTADAFDLKHRFEAPAG